MIYTKDNPKLVRYNSYFKDKKNFTGVVRDERNNVAYFLNGEYHREDGPAIEWAVGNKEWYLNGERHRTDGPAIEHDDGYKEWYVNNKLHREDGPAVEWLGDDKSWYLNNECYGYNDDYTNESWIRFVKLELLK